jgi:hypothetical protein
VRTNAFGSETKGGFIGQKQGLFSQKRRFLGQIMGKNGVLTLLIRQ